MFRERRERPECEGRRIRGSRRGSRAATLALAAAAATAATAAAGCNSSPPLGSETRAPGAPATPSASAALTGAQTFTIRLPAQAGLAGTSLGATNSLRFTDRVAMTSPRTGSSTATSTGPVATDVGTDAPIGSIVSQGAVTIRDRSIAAGDVISAGTITLINGAKILGATRQNTAVTPLQTFTWTATFPTPGADVILAPDAIRTIAPGSYGNVVLNSRAQLHLQAGTYFVNGLQVEPQAKVFLDGGPIFFYVATNVTHKGTIVPGANQRRFLVGVVGPGTLFLETPFIGTIVAPNSTIRFAPTVPALYTGQFFAKDLSVEPMATIVLDTFIDWEDLFPLPDPRPTDVHPKLVCVASAGTGAFNAVFGYVNDAFESLRVRIGTQNQFTPAPAGRGQVQRFYAGKVTAAFATRFTGTAMTWSAGGNTAAASSASTACPTTACASACAAGEQCVGGNCVTLCGDGVCAGDEGCETCPGDCACAAGQACFHNGCGHPARCGSEWQCGSGTSFGVTVSCGTCAGGRPCVNHVCQ